MRLSELDYTLPESQIAQAPLEERGAARLFAVGLEPPHRHIQDLPALLPEGALLVVNDTRVIPARLLGVKESGGKAEIFLLEGMSPDATTWKALGRASKGLRPGMKVRVDALTFTIMELLGGGLFITRAQVESGKDIRTEIERSGHVPLPPYIRRSDDAADRHRYQTIFARHDGAVAAPTAGLHLTPELLTLLAARGITTASVTLHVGLGTFQAVTVEDLDDHPMHSERFHVPADTEEKIALARREGRAVVSVGTTSMRALESAADPTRPGHVRATPLEGSETRLLIQPGHHIQVVDVLLTNFHLPKSTLLALVCAFGGTREVLSAYVQAVRDGYRFFSYGDAMLLTRRATS
jgi:S-adenosylmethionine:tRNA ribosyltransferase-isomerase